MEFRKDVTYTVLRLLLVHAQRFTGYLPWSQGAEKHSTANQVTTNCKCDGSVMTPLAIDVGFSSSSSRVFPFDHQVNAGRHDD